MHRVLEELSFSAETKKGEVVVIDREFVAQRLEGFDPLKKDNLARYIL